MEEIDFKDIRTGMWIYVKHHHRHHGPRMYYEARYFGKVSTINAKWLQLTLDKKALVIPQVMDETFYTVEAKEQKALIADMKKLKSEVDVTEDV